MESRSARARSCIRAAPPDTASITADGASAISAMSSTTPPGPSDSLVAFVAGADLVIYDTTYTEEEYLNHRGWGHSTWQAGVALCKAAGARSMAAFHHHPFRDDVGLDAIDAELAAALPGSFVAREVQSLVLSTHHEFPLMIGV